MAKRTYDIEIDSYIGYPISKKYIREELARCGNRPVTVRINSYGGDVCTALDIRQQFLDHGDVTCYVFGMTASAATILATGAKKLYMGRHAFMLLHQCSMLVDKWDWLNADELESTIEELKKTCTDLHKLDMCAASLYAKRAGCNPEKMHDVMVDAQWLNADECLALGLVDAIDEEEDEPVHMTAAVQRRFAACGLPALPAAKVEEKQEQAPKVSLMDSLANIVATISTWLTAGKQEAPAAEEQPQEPEEPAASAAPAAAVEQPEEPAAPAAPSGDEEQPQEPEEPAAPAAPSGDEEQPQEPAAPAAPSPEPSHEDTAATIASLQAELAEARQRIAELEAMDGADTTPAMPCTAAEHDTAMQHCSDFVRRYKHLI